MKGKGTIKFCSATLLLALVLAGRLTLPVLAADDMGTEIVGQALGDMLKQNKDSEEADGSEAETLSPLEAALKNLLDQYRDQKSDPQPEVEQPVALPQPPAEPESPTADGPMAVAEEMSTAPEPKTGAEYTAPPIAPTLTETTGTAVPPIAPVKDEVAVAVPENTQSTRQSAAPPTPGLGAEVDTAGTSPAQPALPATAPEVGTAVTPTPAPNTPNHTDGPPIAAQEPAPAQNQGHAPAAVRQQAPADITSAAIPATGDNGTTLLAFSTLLAFASTAGIAALWLVKQRRKSRGQ